jgi:hypothetical protein
VGILSDFFVASPEQIVADRFQYGPTGTFSTVESKGITEVELEELLQIVRTGTVDVSVQQHGNFPLILTCPSEESWVLGCPLDLRDALAVGSEKDLAAYASRWAETEQSRFVRFDEATLLSFLIELANLCRPAQARGESLYLWTSL